MKTSISSIKRYRLLVLVFFLMFIVTLGLREIAQRPLAFPDFPAGQASTEIIFIVNNGDSGSIIASNLEKKGVIKSSRTFFQIAVNDSRANRIAAGAYKLDSKIPAQEALEQLLDLKRIIGLIILRDGVRLSEVKSILKRDGYADLEKSLSNIKPPSPFSGKNLEGYLYPARYSFIPDTPVDLVITAMIKRFEQAVADLDFSMTRLRPAEIITVASLIEAEGTPDVFNKIARVIYNRLEIGMALQFDSTIHYFLDQRGDISLSINQTKISNPYNTYQNRGLPPGPIGSPTRPAIVAALNPAEGDWIYFITVAPADTRFTSSYQEFLIWKRQYRENLRNGLFDD